MTLPQRAEKTQSAQQLNAALRRILDEVDETRLPGDAEHAQSFIAQCFQSLPAPEVDAANPKHAAKQAIDAWHFLQDRPGFAPKLTIETLPPAKGKASTVRILTLNDDMPFLVDSLTLVLNRVGYTMLHCLHPMVLARRDEKGHLRNLRPFGKLDETDQASGWRAESVIAIDIPATGTDEDIAALKSLLVQTLTEVRATTGDWKTMQVLTEATIQQTLQLPDSFGEGQLAESIHFLRWLGDGHFIFMGVQDYDLKGKQLLPVKGSALGLFSLEEFGEPLQASATPLAVSQQFLSGPHLVEITKANHRSNVHRPVHLDIIGLKRFNEAGAVIGERRFIGLFTSLAYFKLAKDIPFIRRKIAWVKEQSGFALISHNGKALATILEQMPRDELFQMTEQELYDTAMGVLALEGKPHTQVFVRRDPFERFVSCLLYVPRERFSTNLREKLQDLLQQAYQARVTAHYTQVTESPLARLHVILQATPGQIPEVNLQDLNHQLANAVNAWGDEFRHVLEQHFDPLDASRLHRLYVNAFSDGYRTRYRPEQTVGELTHFEEAIRSQQLQVNLVLGQPEASDFHVRLYNPGQKLALSDILPMLERFGLYVQEERPSEIYPVHYSDGIRLRDFRVQLYRGDAQASLPERKALFEEALIAVWQDRAENDGFNQLILLAGLQWRQVQVLRFYGKYLKQIRFSFDQHRMEDALASHPAIARLLVELFEARFDPDQADAKREDAIIQAIEDALNHVTNSAHDRILRRYRALIRASLRTNHYQPNADGQSKDYLSVKFNPAEVPELPLPRPHAEIFVFGTRVAGVHLRGGKVARGGLRWSDRPEDFRTEVLGLMKAQNVKNTVIVPEGAKGGFVVRRPPAEGGREAFMAEGIACYKTFLCGLLDITDNIAKGKVIPPHRVVRHDQDDPYLVVAADKGTATFSDIANGVSESYGFWLGDAFASGGSAGYDHKGMGITAKGAWVSVARHFQEMGLDVDKEDFTTIGIGDMAGDVFGNGMLRSKHIKLVGAFNHMHIFLDPNPDAAKSFAERERLFNLPRSTWKDYNEALISKGGGIFERSAKSIPLSPEVKELLQVQEDSLPPESLMQAMLKAPVDLLWNGGIGTYAKAASESHDDVGDHANDALRVNGGELRCKVIGEGGNLGFTQLGRIEYAQKGGRLNTDFIDNSAGVDCSDHEVNIKIAFQRAMEKKGGLSREARNKLLAEMTDEVSELVLRDNRLQTQALTLAQSHGATLLETQARLIRQLERERLLDRAIEYLPGEDELANRKLLKHGLTRPELAILLSYSKIALYRELLNSNLPDNAYFTTDLLRYFPKPMQDGFSEEIVQHPLRRELIATAVTNSIINRMGSTFFYQAAEDTGMLACDIARAYVTTRDGFNLRELWEGIEALGVKTSTEMQMQMFRTINQLIYRCTIWFLRNLPQPLDVDQAIRDYQPLLTRLVKELPGLLKGNAKTAYKEAQAELKAAGVPAALAGQIALMPALASACDIARASLNTGIDVIKVAETYFQMANDLRFDWLTGVILSLPTEDYWSRQAANALMGDLLDQQRNLTTAMLRENCVEDGSCAIGWARQHAKDVARYHQFMDDLATNERLDISILVVALRKIQSMLPLE